MRNLIWLCRRRRRMERRSHNGASDQQRAPFRVTVGKDRVVAIRVGGEPDRVGLEKGSWADLLALRKLSPQADMNFSLWETVALFMSGFFTGIALMIVWFGK